MFSRPSLVTFSHTATLALGALFASALPAPAGTTPVSQTSIGKNACGPCAMLNALKFGGVPERAMAHAITGSTDTDRVRAIIQKFGSGPSEVRPDRPRYRPAEGMCDLELLGMARDIAAAGGLRPVTGASLDRTSDTPHGVHIREVFTKLRRSLDAGFPPIVLICAFAATETDSKTNNDDYTWHVLTDHWVAVVSLPDKLRPGAVSFTMRVADSETGAIQEAFVCEELSRNFTAAKGNDINYTWPSVPHPFLTVNMPILSFGTGNTPWYLRTNIVLSYAVFRQP